MRLTVRAVVILAVTRAVAMFQNVLIGKRRPPCSSSAATLPGGHLLSAHLLHPLVPQFICRHPHDGVLGGENVEVVEVVVVTRPCEAAAASGTERTLVQTTTTRSSCDAHQRHEARVNEAVSILSSIKFQGFGDYLNY
jgi:hypothetical protein